MTNVKGENTPRWSVKTHVTETNVSCETDVINAVMTSCCQKNSYQVKKHGFACHKSAQKTPSVPKGTNTPKQKLIRSKQQQMRLKRRQMCLKRRPNALRNTPKASNSAQMRHERYLKHWWMALKAPGASKYIQNGLEMHFKSRKALCGAWLAPVECIWMDVETTEWRQITPTKLVPGFVKGPVWRRIRPSIAF